MEEDSESLIQDKVNLPLLIVITVLVFGMTGVIIYQNTVIDKWKDKYMNASQDLNDSRAELNQLRREYQNMQEDLRRYDQIYGKQKSQLKYSKEIALIEVFQRTSKEECIPETSLDLPDFSELSVTAKGEGKNPVVHVFLDERYADTWELSKNFSLYTTELETYRSTHKIDLVFYKEASDEMRGINVRSMNLGGHELNKSDTVYDTGIGPRIFNCEETQEGWDMRSTGSLRFSVEKE